MTDDIAIRVEGLGKKYLIGHESERERYMALRDVMARGARSIWRKTVDMACGREIIAGDTVEKFWALREVGFEVKRGEVLGIIGRNGAGKSTLLKILSRITEPSEGRVTINGRVASLLEVGTGFHPELTGRENIYLNGAILGMKRSEIRRKFDEIVAFAQVEKFLDTPVKRYSSGMYVRLAFAVAAHLEPEILVIDEVLAVGDAEFQQKCLGKMNQVAHGGRTVLFVSHNLSAVTDLCARAVLLEGGTLERIGEVHDTIAAYMERSRSNLIGKTVTCQVAGATISLRLSMATPGATFASGTPLELILECKATQDIRLDHLYLILENAIGHRVGTLDFRVIGSKLDLSAAGNRYIASVANADLVEGLYLVKCGLRGLGLQTELEVGSLEVIATSNSRKLSQYDAQWNGILNFRGELVKAAAYLK